MPSYDVECSKCGFHEILSCKLAELDNFDKSSVCPSCSEANGSFRRVIKTAPISTGGEKANLKSKNSKKLTDKKNFVSSGAKDDMLHRQAKNYNSDQAESSREIVRTGKYEGF